MKIQALILDSFLGKAFSNLWVENAFYNQKLYFLFRFDRAKQLMPLLLSDVILINGLYCEDYYQSSLVYVKNTLF